jgi:hypothetical protein
MFLRSSLLALLLLVSTQETQAQFCPSQYAFPTWAWSDTEQKHVEWRQRLWVDCRETHHEEDV